MKLIDRYVLNLFLKNYLISFLVLVGLYIVMDMVFQFDELAELQEQAGASGIASAVAIGWRVLQFYFFNSFMIFAHLSGIIPVVAATFTLMRLARFNELTAMLAAGVPLVRVAAPIILVSVILNVLLIVDQELIIPRIIPELTRKHDQLLKSSGPSFPIPVMKDDRNGLLTAALYTPGSPAQPPTMRFVDITVMDEQRNPVARISADMATWDEANDRWILDNGTQTTGLREGVHAQRPIEVYQSNINPEEIALYRSGDYVQLLSTERINQLLQRPQSYGTKELLRVKHARFTQWIGNIILLLLAIPCVLTREPGNVKMAALKCVTVVGLCMATIFIAQNLAASPPSPRWTDTWPALMAWLPLILFGPVAVYLLDRVKT